MTPARCDRDALIELYFYGELSAAEAAEAAAHAQSCDDCRRALADLHAIESALLARRVDAPAGGDWNGFMARLDDRLDSLETLGAGPAARASRWWLQAAAAVALVATGALAGWTFSRATPAAPVEASPADVALDRAGGSGLDRARVLLAGLAGKPDGADWALERAMAARLLPEVALIRQAAAVRGRADLDDILMDVETLLLQASYAERDDAETLSRLRRMIDRRDVLMRLSLAAADADAPSGARRAVLSRPGA